MKIFRASSTRRGRRTRGTFSARMAPRRHPKCHPKCHPLGPISLPDSPIGLPVQTLPEIYSFLDEPSATNDRSAQMRREIFSNRIDRNCVTGQRSCKEIRSCRQFYFYRCNPLVRCFCFVASRPYPKQPLRLFVKKMIELLFRSVLPIAEG